MRKWKRVFLSVGIAVILLVVYAVLFGSQTMDALLARYELRKLPDVAETPAGLADTSIATKPHRKATHFGYEFELPWDDVDEQKSKTRGQIEVIAFRSGNAFWFSAFPPKDFVHEIMKTGQLDPESFRRLCGDEASESDYGFNKIMLQATPSDITPFVSPRRAAAAVWLLMIKGMSMPPAKSGIFSIQAGDFRGFQFENPRSRPNRISDYLYSEHGGIDLIFFQKVDGSAPVISQPEINRIIESIQAIPVAARSSIDRKSK
jgi:hypothetical protein